MPEKKNGKQAFQKRPKLKNKEYERELRKLQTKLVEMQEWVKSSGAKVVVVFEGRDAAGKARSACPPSPVAAGTLRPRFRGDKLCPPYTYCSNNLR